jgi:hypothetical protein
MMEILTEAKRIATELEEKLGHNHISTILQNEKLGPKDAPDKKLLQLLIIVKKYDKYTLMVISNILREYKELLEIPYVVEYIDIQNMLDSIPDPFLEIKLNYEVLAGQDVMEMVRPPSYEHFRAQMELTLRNEILSLRRDLIRVMSHQMNSQEYMKELSVVALNCIRSYYQIINPKLHTSEEFITNFNQDFPQGKEVLNRLLNSAYSLIKGTEVLEDEKLDMILLTINNVLQPILIEVDALGIEFEKNLAKASEALTYDEFLEKYGPEIERLQDALAVELEQQQKKQEYIVRGELELKFRKREKDMEKRFESDQNEQKKFYEDKIKQFEDTFDEKLEERTVEFKKQKQEEYENKFQDEYDTKLKGIRDELELKYITTDLREKEEKLRTEFQEYEKNIRENFELKEKTLREELDMKLKNYKESLELEYNAKQEDEKEKMRRDFEGELEDSIGRVRRHEERRYEAELKRRLKQLEISMKKEFARREKDLNRQSRRELQAREAEVKTKLLLNFEREKLKIESKKSDAFLKLIEKEMAIKYKELDKLKVPFPQAPLVQQVQAPESLKGKPKGKERPIGTRSFLRPPDSSESDSEGGLFSKILNDNRILVQGLVKRKKFK